MCVCVFFFSFLQISSATKSVTHLGLVLSGAGHWRDTPVISQARSNKFSGADGHMTRGKFTEIAVDYWQQHYQLLITGSKNRLALAVVSDHLIDRWLGS